MASRASRPPASFASSSRKPSSSTFSRKATTLVPIILGNVKNFEPGAGKRHFEQGRQEARKKEMELLERLRVLPNGKQKPKRSSG